MKKLTALFLVLILLFGLAACAGDGIDPSFPSWDVPTDSKSDDQNEGKRYNPPSEAPQLTGDEDQVMGPIAEVLSSNDFENMDREERVRALKSVLEKLAGSGKTCVSGAQIDVDSILAEDEFVCFHDLYGIEYVISLYDREPGTAGGSAVSVSAENISASHFGTVSEVFPSGTPPEEADVLVLYGLTEPDESRGEYNGYRSVAENIRNQNLTTCFKGKATVDDFKHLDGHKIVWICEHGCILGGSPCFSLSEEVNATTFQEYYPDLISSGFGILTGTRNRVAIHITKELKPVFVLGTQFFDYYYPEKKLDGTAVFFSVCCSYGSEKDGNDDSDVNTRLVDTLIHCGADAVTAWYDASYIMHDMRLYQTVFGQLIAGKTLREAVWTAQRWRGETASEFIRKKRLVLLSKMSSDYAPSGKGQYENILATYNNHFLYLTPETSVFQLKEKPKTQKQLIEANLPGEEAMWPFGPTTFEYHNHACCMFPYFNFSWTQAEEFCESLGGHLLQISEETLQDFIWNSGYPRCWDCCWMPWVDAGKENTVLSYEDSIRSGGTWSDCKIAELSSWGSEEDSGGFICEWDKSWDDLDLPVTILDPPPKDDPEEPTTVAPPEETTAPPQNADDLLDQFIAGIIPAHEGDKTFYINDLYADSYAEYKVGDRLDLDNDGENELIMNAFGGLSIYLDAADGRVNVFVRGEGKGCVPNHVHWQDAEWIILSDSSHAGREVLNLYKYAGAENLVDSFELSATYDGQYYNASSKFSYRGKSISIEEYESLKKDIFSGSH